MVSARPTYGRLSARLVAAVAILTVVALLGDVAPAAALTGSGHPATWKTWILPSADQFRAGSPPADDSLQTFDELHELRRIQRERTPWQERKVRFWNVGAPTLRWTQVALDMILIHRPGAFPTRTARILALLHFAMYDAMVAAFDSKQAYERARPAELDPRIEPMVHTKGSSYPDVRSAIAGAAETMLVYLFPGEDPSTFTGLADKATESRLWAGVNYRSDVEAGRSIGQQVAQVVIDWGNQDGSQLPWDFADQRLCSTPNCAGPDENYWVPTPLLYQYPPTDPMASKWKTLLMSGPSELRPPPPPAYGSSKFYRQVARVKDANDNASQQDLELAFFWDDGPGTYSPAGHWNSIAITIARNRRLGMAQTARLFALMNAAIRDAFIAVWDAKYTYWNIRPITVIRERPTINGEPNPYYDPEWLSNIVTPPFPSYPSGHAGESAAAARVLQYFFPDSESDPPIDIDNFGPQGSIDLIAEEVALSRLIGGIHFPIDNDTSLVLGREIARLAILRAQSDGGGTP